MPSGYGTTKTRYYRLAGGLDLVTPALSVPPGRCLAMANYEPYFSGGYRRCAGYERFDGRPKPSDATFVGFDVSSTAGLVEGAAITSSGGAAGVVAAIDGLHLAVTKVTGTFALGHTVTGGGSITTNPGTGVAPDQDAIDEFLIAAQDIYRADIAVVPGIHAVRGVWRRDATVYAIRDDDDSAGQAILHKSSATGWTTSGITMTQYLYFDAGGAGTAHALPAEGVAINGATSGATATVHRVIELGGSTGANDSYGYLVLKSVTGQFRDNESLRIVATAFATAASAGAKFSLPAGGRYRFINHNFFGGSGTRRTYAVNGIGPAIEIDENHVVSPILMPLVAVADQPTVNTPFLIREHRNYLFLAMPGGTFVHSVVGEPMVMNGFLGAAEFGVGAEITGLSSVAGNVLVVTTDGFTKGLYGSDPSDWDFKLIGEKTGGKLNGVQLLDTVYALDDLGITSLARVQSFGDFAGATVSQLIQPLLQTYRTRITDSALVRASNQYRVYFDDGTAVVMYVRAAGGANQNDAGGVEFGYLVYPITVAQIYNSEDETGEERTYFLTDDSSLQGYVFEDQIGTSFDGEEIASYIRLAFNHVGSPAYRKRFRRADLEISATRPLELRFVHDISYGAPEISSGITDMTTVDVQQVAVYGGGGFWDVSAWDQFYWDGQNIATARGDLNGSGENIGFLVFNQSAIAPPFILQGLTLHYDLRRLQR